VIVAVDRSDSVNPSGSTRSRSTPVPSCTAKMAGGVTSGGRTGGTLVTENPCVAALPARSTTITAPGNVPTG
jgi:hypothetical protein